jgi:hypothetical protein
MAAALDLLEAVADEHDAHEHLLRECPWFRHVTEGGGGDVESHCQPAKGEGKVPRLVVKLTPRTPEASTVPEPTVPPGGPGLFHIKGRELPPYVQHLWHHLAAKYGKHKAYGMAVGIVKKWAAGVNPGGKHPTKTHPDVRAAAQKNVAEWEKDKADAHEEHRAAATAVGLAVATAPGARPFFTPPTPGGTYEQYGLHQHPSATVSPSPPLPPAVAVPSPGEIRALIPLVPDCSKPELSATARKFLEQAAGKMAKGNAIEALGMLRSAESAVLAAHKADQGDIRPSVFTANIFTAVPPAEQSSATAAMKQGMDRSMAWRKVEVQLQALADRIRKRYFHGVFSGPSSMARMSEEPMSALDKLALAVTTGKDVSEPVTSDVSGRTPLIQPPEDLLNIADPDAQKQLDALPAIDKARVNAYLDAARGMVATNYSGAAQFALRACVIARESGAHDLARHIRHHVQALGEMGNMTVTAREAGRMGSGGKTVSPSDNRQVSVDPNAKLTAVDRLVELAAGAGKTAGHSAGASVPHHPDAHQLHVEHLEHLHRLHTEHLEHLHHLHTEHLQHMTHQQSQGTSAGTQYGTTAAAAAKPKKPKSGPATPGPVARPTTGLRPV